jgi:signal transduction histidine kinase
VVPVVVAEHVLGVVREALSNVARHADATAVRVDVEVGECDLQVVVADNGRGIGAVSRRSGLANMEKRAALVHGSFEVERQPDGGTRLTWSASLQPT